MSKLITVLSICILLAGCASMTYTTQAPDGTITTVSYTRLLTTSDTIKGSVGNATVESRGQTNIDPVVLQKIIGAILMAP